MSKKNNDWWTDKEKEQGFAIRRVNGQLRKFSEDGSSTSFAQDKYGKDAYKKTDAQKRVAIKNRNKNTDADDDNSDASMARRKLLLKYKQERERLVALRDKMKESRFKPTFERLKQRHETSINELSKDKYGSGTYDVDTLKPISYEKGYQVTFSQIGDDYDADTYYQLCDEFLRFSSDKKICAGKFEGTPEVSFNIEDRDKAIELAQKYNQISIWDWENADEIKTGGRGRRL